MAGATAFLLTEIHVQKVVPGNRHGFGNLELQHCGLPLLHSETALGALLMYPYPSNLWRNFTIVYNQVPLGLTLLIER